MNANEFKQFEITMKAQEHEVTGKVLYPPTLLSDKGPAKWEDYTGRRLKHV